MSPRAASPTIIRLAAILLAAVFLAICAGRYWVAVGRISNNTDLDRGTFSRPINGRHFVSHEFTARSSTLGPLNIFAAPQDLARNKDEMIVLHLVDPAKLEVMVTVLVADHGAPQAVGTRITFRASAVGGAPPLQYRWWVHDGTGWRPGQTWSASNDFAWTPSTANAAYAVAVWVRSATSTADGPDLLEATAVLAFPITPHRPGQSGVPANSSALVPETAGGPSGAAGWIRGATTNADALGRLETKGGLAVPIYRLESTVGAAAHPNSITLFFNPGWRVEQGKRYWLRLSLPHAAGARGLSFAMSPPLEPGSDTLRIDGEVQEGMVLSHLFLGGRARAPLGLILGGVLLAGISMVLFNRVGAWPLLMATAGMAMTLSEYRWEQLLWAFWGWYWPDGYPIIAHRIFLWFSGASSFGDLVDYLSANRKGANFLVPLLMASLHAVGVPYIFGYALISGVFSVGSILVLDRYAATHWKLRGEHRAFLVLLAGLNVIVIDCVARPLTDAGGMFFTVLFVAGFADYAKGSAWVDRSMWIAASSAFLGILTRTALLPLFLVPVAWILWRWMFSRPRERGIQMLRYLTAPLVAAALVVITFTYLRLWGCYAADYALGRSMAVPFSLPTFAQNSVLALQCALPLGLLRWRKFLTDEPLAILMIAILGFEGMLFAMGGITPFARYWAPVAPLASGIVAGLLLDEEAVPRRWQLAVLASSVAGNVAYATTVSAARMAGGL